VSNSRNYLFIGGVGHEEIYEVPNDCHGFAIPVYPRHAVHLKIPFDAASAHSPDFTTSIHRYVYKEYRVWHEGKGRWLNVKVYQWEGWTDEKTIEYFNERYGV